MRFEYTPARPFLKVGHAPTLQMRALIFRLQRTFADTFAALGVKLATMDG
jgi:hypothetical protein